MMQLFVKICALLCISLMLAHPAYSQTAVAVPATPATPAPATSEPKSVSRNIANGIGSMLDSIDVAKLTATPQRDLLTLAIGGLTGFATGGFFSGLGILNIEILGLAVIPLAGGLAGIYFANEGYFDQPRKMIGDKF